MCKTFWDDAYREDPAGAVVPDRVLDREVADLIPGTALDLGCGSGPNALKLAVRGWSVMGVDWSAEAIRLARQAAEQLGHDARFVVADLTTWQPPQLFDLVISTYALPGGEDSGRVLATAATAVAPGGVVIVAEWDRSMAEPWGFDQEDLPTPDSIAAMLPELVIEKAGVLTVQDMFTGDDPRAAGETVRIALVRARKP